MVLLSSEMLKFICVFFCFCQFVSILPLFFSNDTFSSELLFVIVALVSMQVEIAIESQYIESETLKSNGKDSRDIDNGIGSSFAGFFELENRR